VRLNGDLRKTERLLREVKEVVNAQSPPKLMLNDHCQVCEFRQRCHDQAVQEDNISLLRGMGEKEIKRYARKGIFSVTQLAHTFRPRRKGKKQLQTTHKRHHALQALAIRDKKIYIFGTPELKASPVRIYLDMEGDPDEGYVYLIGMIVAQGDSETTHSFWADDKEQEYRIFEEFLAEVGKFENFQVFCYGGYERAFLMRMRKQAKRKGPVDKVLKALVNTLSLIYSHIYFPTYSNGLKDIGGCLGCSWTEPDASGIQSVVWRKKWETTTGEEWKRRLTTYNFEDCAALRKVTEFVYATWDRGNGTTESSSDCRNSNPVERVQNAAELPGAGAWAQGNFAHPDYEYLNRCAYFDYQRQRVYARTSSTLRKSRRKEQQSKNRMLRVSNHIEVRTSKCPCCGSTELQHRERKKQAKRAYDLVITTGSLKRKVIECRAPLHICVHCGNKFMPERYQRLDRHYHGVKSWAMYHHVAHRDSFGTLEEMAKELFGLRIYKPEFKMFKSLMARYYETTYRKLLKKILSGHLLHIDETEVKLQTGKGYVWVFATLEEVVFMYRPTREGNFLQKLLRDFHGVLVSDFYSAYDSINCPQQKCLIHLIRDMNQELLNNPYDEELQSITRPFGALLRAVVETVDKHGLKRRYLQKHKQDVEDFFQGVSVKAFHSEVAELLRNRLTKNRDKLFTFIDHDGIPWNNNNAENAIKRFAYYRENAGSRLTEAGLTDFLVLLSICQTCRYKGISFLRFLLSRERDLDSFSDRKRPRRCPPALQIYPKGFTPPNFRKRHDQKLPRQLDKPENEVQDTQ